MIEKSPADDLLQNCTHTTDQEQNHISKYSHIFPKELDSEKQQNENSQPPSQHQKTLTPLKIIPPSICKKPKKSIRTNSASMSMDFFPILTLEDDDDLKYMRIVHDGEIYVKRNFLGTLSFDTFFFVCEDVTNESVSIHLSLPL